MKTWTLKLEREQEGYFRNFLGPSIDGPGPVEVVEKSEYDKMRAALRTIYGFSISDKTDDKLKIKVIIQECCVALKD